MEKVIYFSSYIVTKVNEEARDGIMEAIESEYKSKVKKEKTEAAKNELKQAREKAKEELLDIKEMRILSEVVYHTLSMKYGEVFEAGTGAEVVKELFTKVDLEKETEKIAKEAKEAPPAMKKKVLRRLKLFQGMLKAGYKAGMDVYGCFAGFASRFKANGAVGWRKICFV